MSAPGRLPVLFVGRRRWLLFALAGLGLAQAGLSVLTALLTPRLLGGQGSAVLLSGVLVLGALVIGGIRIGERVLSEDLGQDYVREVRRLIVASALTPARSLNLGATITRASNDLSAVKNWVALGISPMVVGIPLVTGIMIAMFLITPVMGLVLACTLAVFAGLMFALSGPLFRRARSLRRVRGKMSGHIADAVTAGESIRISGGVSREVQRIDKLSGKVVDAARSRALVSGAMRGSAASVTAILAVLVAVFGAAAGSSTADITGAVFIAGLLAAPVTDLGRVGEYRQNQKAAQRVLEPVLENARAHQKLERRLGRQADRLRHHRDTPGLARGAVHVADLMDRDGSYPELIAAPGSRVLLTGESSSRIDRVLGHLTGDRVDPGAWVCVAGRQLTMLPSRTRRELVGHASSTIPIERASIARVVRYRIPDDESDISELLCRVGLDAKVDSMPDGERTTLRRGGEPLTSNERARLKLARALAGSPPLLILDHLEDQLDRPGRELLRTQLDDYPGCVIVRSHNPEAIMACYDVWNVDELDPTLVIALPAATLPVRGLRRTTHLAGAGTLPFGPPVGRSVLERQAVRRADEDDLPSDDEDDE